MSDNTKKIKRMSVTKILLIGYLSVIVVGTVLLSLPFAVKEGQSHGVFDSFFTSTSAACVTGLIRFDTATHWSLFGKCVILGLIQIGGVGFMTLCVYALSLTKLKIGLAFRSLAQSAMSAPDLSGVVRMTKYIIKFTLITEGVGALLLSFFFCPRAGVLRGIGYSVFHSISAFCNAGFDLMGEVEPFSSFTTEAGNVYLNVVLMLLIIAGGLGFFVWHDLYDSRLRPKKFKLQTKVVLTVSAILVFGGAALIFLFEKCAAPETGTGDLVLTSLFQSISARTAGFNTVDLASLSSSAKLVMIFLMAVGGSPGSTAGGIKTTTLAVLIATLPSTFRRKKSPELFGRRLEENLAETAIAVVMMYATLIFGAALVITNVDGVGLLDAIFEATSAAATVGVTTGATPGLSVVSAGILSLLMIFGRVGSLTVLFAFASSKYRVPSSLPMEKLQVG